MRTAVAAAAIREVALAEGGVGVRTEAVAGPEKARVARAAALEAAAALVAASGAAVGATLAARRGAVGKEPGLVATVTPEAVCLVRVARVARVAMVREGPAMERRSLGTRRTRARSFG